MAQINTVPELFSCFGETTPNLVAAQRFAVQNRDKLTRKALAICNSLLPRPGPMNKTIRGCATPYLLRAVNEDDAVQRAFLMPYEYLLYIDWCVRLSVCIAIMFYAEPRCLDASMPLADVQNLTKALFRGKNVFWKDITDVISLLRRGRAGDVTQSLFDELRQRRYDSERPNALRPPVRTLARREGDRESPRSISLWGGAISPVLQGSDSRVNSRLEDERCFNPISPDSESMHADNSSDGSYSSGTDFMTPSPTLHILLEEGDSNHPVEQYTNLQTSSRESPQIPFEFVSWHLFDDDAVAIDSSDSQS
jgi:hypothetical protein